MMKKRLRKHFPPLLSLIIIMGIGMVFVVWNQPIFGQTAIKKWTIQSGLQVQGNGDVISRVHYDDASWYPTIGASTVLAALVKNGEYPDPYYGTNLLKIPGYRSGARLGLSKVNPFKAHWWYRSEFRLPVKQSGNNLYLLLHSVNYKANVWINGILVADSTKIEGAFRLFELDITDYIKPDDINAIALEIVPPTSLDPSIRWMQGTRTPPDNDAGIWYDVKIKSGGSIHIKDPHVVTKLNLPAMDRAQLTISSILVNKARGTIKGNLQGTITHVNNIIEGGTSEGSPGKITFSQDINLKKGETIVLSKQLEITNPKIWWPVNVGKQNLYDLVLEVKSESGVISERDTIRFGIREVSVMMETYNDSVPMIGQSKGLLAQKRIEVHWINGKRILIRGGDWTDNMMMETTPAEEEAAIKYAKNMNLNTLRLEGLWGSDYFFDLADKYGIMIFDGLNCCSIWEQWAKWTEHTADVAVASLQDQVIRLRNHPSVVYWALGSDNYPPERIERRYIDVVTNYAPGTPYITVMSNRTSKIFGYTGYCKRPRLYGYPIEWYSAEGLNWESGGVGDEQIPPIESMRAMMPEKDLWPISESWDIRLWNVGTTYAKESREAYWIRYGTPQDLEEYCTTSQPWQYESNRAVYEATARGKYLTSGNLKYRYNTGWPALCFQFYDYYLRPNGAFFGTQTACEPLHVQYGYDDNYVYVVNSFYKSFTNLQVTATIYNLDMTEKYQKTGSIDIGSDGSEKVFQIPKINGLSDTYFLYLQMKDEMGKEVSRNFYWLSAEGDLQADFRNLSALTTVDLQVTSTFEQNGKYSMANIVVKNTSNELAFFINPTIIKGLHGMEVLPVYWSSNYFSLLPNKSYLITATFDIDLLAGKKPHLMIDGWNIKPREYILSEPNKDVTPQLKYAEFLVPDSISSAQKFDISVKVSNDGIVGNCILESRQYLFIDGHSQDYQRIALAPGESKVLKWLGIQISEPGKHQLTIGEQKPVTITVGQ